MVELRSRLDIQSALKALFSIITERYIRHEITIEQGQSVVRRVQPEEKVNEEKDKNASSWELLCKMFHYLSDTGNYCILHFIPQFRLMNVVSHAVFGRHVFSSTLK